MTMRDRERRERQGLPEMHAALSDIPGRHGSIGSVARGGTCDPPPPVPALFSPGPAQPAHLIF